MALSNLFPSKESPFANTMSKVKAHLEYLRNEPHIWKLELEMRKRKRIYAQDASFSSRIQLRKNPDILAAFKKDEVTLAHFNSLVPNMFYDVQLPTNLSNLNAYLVIPDEADHEQESSC